MAPPAWLAAEYARRAREAEASGGQTIEEAFGQERVVQAAGMLRKIALPAAIVVGLLVFMGRR